MHFEILRDELSITIIEVRHGLAGFALRPDQNPATVAWYVSHQNIAVKDVKMIWNATHVW